MIVSVKKNTTTHLLCKENKQGFLENIQHTHTTRRQDSELHYEYNGAIYIINAQSIQNKGLTACSKRIKYCMPDEYSIDIDTELDWEIAEYLMQKNRN